MSIRHWLGCTCTERTVWLDITYCSCCGAIEDREESREESPAAVHTSEASTT